MIVGENPDFEAGQRVSKQGFLVYSHDLEGKCFDSLGEDNLYDYPSKVLGFGELSDFTCAVSLDPETSPKDHCEAAAENFAKLELSK